ncbi:MAG: PH domain-containing protein [Candidatus Nomurabacteria bacterium]
MVEKSIKNKIPLSYFWYAFTKLVLIIILISMPFSIAGGGMSAFKSIFILFGIPITIYLYLSYKNFFYIIDDDKITTYRGILSKSTKTISFNTIQNVETNNGVISRIFNISEINIWTSSPSQIEIRRGGK